MKLYFIAKCINTVYCVMENTLNVYKINKLFQVTLCFSL